jgi:ribose/xylose/arabinose/galactoside ABC-type transport system permease subunit
METTATKSLEPAVQIPWGNRLLHLASRFTVLIALLLLIATFSILSPDFLQFDNWSNIILQSATLGIAATGATLVIIIAGIDLSVGSVIALAGILAAGLMVHQHLPGWLGWVVCLAVGALVGFFNGLSISWLGLSAFIATLSTLAMGRGLTLAYCNGQTIYNLPDTFSFLGSGSCLGIPVPIYITLLVFIVMHFLLSQTVFGHEVYAIGGNREAARLAGINVRRVETLVYVTAGTLSGLASIVLTGRLTAALPSSATGFELDVIAAVVIGGASLFGGRGSMVGTFFGVLTIGVLRNGLTLLNVSPFWVQFVQGAVIFVAVLLDALGQRHRRAHG